jgi:hypothetical protein
VHQGPEGESLCRALHHDLHTEEVVFVLHELHGRGPGEGFEGRWEFALHERVGGIRQKLEVQELEGGDSVLGQGLLGEELPGLGGHPYLLGPDLEEDDGGHAEDGQRHHRFQKHETAPWMPPH